MRPFTLPIDYIFAFKAYTWHSIIYLADKNEKVKYWQSYRNRVFTYSTPGWNGYQSKQLLGSPY